MIVFRDEDGDSTRRPPVSQAPAHLEALRDLFDAAHEALSVGMKVARVEANALKELPGDAIRMLVRVDDIGAVPVEELREGGDQALSVWAA